MKVSLEAGSGTTSQAGSCDRPSTCMVNVNGMGVISSDD
jgi:hypothetical protein